MEYQRRYEYMYFKRCQHCNTEFEYEISGNFIVFCPHCRKCVLVECEYGYGPVVPCNIFLGKEEIATVTNHTKNVSVYRYDSDKFNIHKILSKKYLEALEEARDITAVLLD